VDSKSVINFDIELLEVSDERLTSELDFFNNGFILLGCAADTSVVDLLALVVLVHGTLLFEILLPGRE